MATKKAAATTGKVVSTNAKQIGKLARDRGRKRRSKESLMMERHGIINFHVYIHRVLKFTHPTLSISKSSMSIMNSFLFDMYNRLIKEGVFLMKINNKKTLNQRAFQTAVKMILPGELAKHALSEGVKAITKYHNHIDL